MNEVTKRGQGWPDYSMRSIREVYKAEKAGRSELNKRVYDECVAYDDGHRIAIYTQLGELIARAKQQAKRSGETATLEHASDDDMDLHALDVKLVAALLRARDVA